MIAPVDVQRSDDPVARSQIERLLVRPRRLASGSPSSIRAASNASVAGDVGGDAAELILHAHALEQRGRDPRQQRRLALPLLGLGAARRRARAASSLTTTADTR